MARLREAVGCRTLICGKADSGQLNYFSSMWLLRTSSIPVPSGSGARRKHLIEPTDRGEPRVVSGPRARQAQARAGEAARLARLLESATNEGAQ